MDHLLGNDLWRHLEQLQERKIYELEFRKTPAKANQLSGLTIR